MEAATKTVVAQAAADGSGNCTKYTTGGIAQILRTVRAVGMDNIKLFFLFCVSVPPPSEFLDLSGGGCLWVPVVSPLAATLFPLRARIPAAPRLVARTDSSCDQCGDHRTRARRPACCCTVLQTKVSLQRTVGMETDSRTSMKSNLKTLPIEGGKTKPWCGVSESRRDVAQLCTLVSERAQARNIRAQDIQKQLFSLS